MKRHYSKNGPSFGSQAGMSILDVAVIIGVVGVLMAGFLASYKLYQAQRATAITEENMQAVQEALGTFVALYNRYPVPAHYGLTETDAAYGREGTTRAACATATAAVGKVCEGTGEPAGRVVLTGMVPFAEINITPQMARDGFGRMLTYAVAADLTLANGADPFMVGSDLTYHHYVCVDYQNIDRNGAFTTIACGSANNPAKAIALVSHGKDGIGAWLPSGQQFQACSTAANGSQNLNCNFGGRFVQSMGTGVRYQHATDGSGYNAANEVDEEMRPISISATGLRLNDDTLQTEIREDTNFWSRDASDNISNRYSYHVGIGLTTPPVTPLDVNGPILAQDRVLADKLCDDTKTNCLETEAIAGTKSEMDCESLGMVTEIKNNQVTCIFPVNPHVCPAGQYVRGADVNGTPICVSSPHYTTP